MIIENALTSAPVVSPDQLDLIKRTIAQGATDAELKLYLFDCQRQNVHPLDRLLHFTKRGGKYTPVTSIDLMRIRAAETGEYAGSDDALFVEGELHPISATVTVWRLVQGQRYAFTATARWDEYYPGEQSGHMWRKMDHTMLAKCSEALALRKGFPRQLAGLYASEELDQAQRTDQPAAAPTNGGIHVVVATPETRMPESDDNAYMPAGLDTSDPPTGAVYLTKVAPGMGKAKGFLFSGTSLRDGFAVYRDAQYDLARNCCLVGDPVIMKFKTSAAGNTYVDGITRAPKAPSLSDTESMNLADDGEAFTLDESGQDDDPISF